MDGLGKLLGRRYPAIEVIWARYAFALPVAMAMTSPSAWPTLLPIRAFALAPASLLTPFTHAQIVAATAFGALAFEAIPDRWTLLGTTIVILSGVYVLRRRPD